MRRSMLRFSRIVASPPLQDAGPVQDFVDQRIDGDHMGASLGPEGLWATEEQTGQRHRQDLVRNAVDVPQRPYDRLSHADRPVRVRWIVSFGQAPVDPSHQVPIGRITNEQEQAVGDLVQAAIAQRVQRQGTGREMFRLILR
jgi:hypothetical protein